MNKKTFVITVSKSFMKGHPEAGGLTYFKVAILTGEKIHTIRGNYPYWKRIVDRVNDGSAFLSIREWSEKPYRSKQVEITSLMKLGIQKVWRRGGVFWIDGNPILSSRQEGKLAHNDGLSPDDFRNWFPEEFEGCVIHFTDFRY